VLGALQGGAVLDEPDAERGGGLADVAAVSAGSPKDAADVERAAPRRYHVRVSATVVRRCCANAQKSGLSACGIGSRSW
jgi:hypothetical protein